MMTVSLGDIITVAMAGQWTLPRHQLINIREKGWSNCGVKTIREVDGEEMDAFLGSDK